MDSKFESNIELYDAKTQDPIIRHFVEKIKTLETTIKLQNWTIEHLTAEIKILKKPNLTSQIHISMSKQMIGSICSYDQDPICNNWADIDSANYYRASIAAAESGKLSAVKYLTSIGADIHDDNAALRSAAYYGHLEVVKYLVSMGANIHVDDAPPLSLAVMNGHFEVVKYLVSMGANINAYNLDNEDDAPPLSLAAQNGHLEIVKYLVSMGANINDNDAALSLAARNCHLKVVKYLVLSQTN